MKYMIIACLQFLCISTLQAQSILFGLTNNGGNGIGTLFAADKNGRNPSSKYYFQPSDGLFPQGDLIQATDGKLYGMTSGGGENDSQSGIIFEFDPVRSTYNIDKNLPSSNIDGIAPLGSLLQASNGKMYGYTTGGGAGSTASGTNLQGGGVLFEFDPVTKNYIVRVDFGSNYYGGSPTGNLIQANNGKLYGMTQQGGAYLRGTLIEFDPITFITTVKVNFMDDPHGSLLQASNGILYGMTTGNISSNGSIFNYDPATDTYLKIVTLTTVTGTFPYGSLVQATNGKLYGMTSGGGLYGGGTLFELDPSTNSFVKKIDFNTVTGQNPHGSLMQATNGKLYGMTSQGGDYNDGTLFNFDPTSGILTKNLDFNSLNGKNPYGSLMQASDGKLYGMATAGGIPLLNSGVIFQYDPVTNIQSVLWNFDYGSEGTYPQGSVVYGTDSLFYGLTYRGGTIDKGALFSYNPKTDTYTKKQDLDLTVTGVNPYGSLIQAADGKFYGMASSGGTNNQGTLFSYDAIGNILNKKVDFTTLSGANPYGSLLQAPNGLLYGVASQGGTNDKGVLFSYDPASNTYTKKMDLDSITQGSHPKGSLVLAPVTGKLYGLTSSGGSSGTGTLFSYDYAGNIFINVFNFTTLLGSNPTGSLVLANNNLLYGMTSTGGANNLGTLFSFDPAGNVFTKIIDFTTTTGTNPMGSLRLSSNGKFYGMTNTGGDNNLGTVFEFDPATNTFTKTIDFDGTNGANPTYGNLVEICLYPRFTTGSQNITTCVGSPLQLSSGTAGGETFQWYANGTSITGAVNAVLTVLSAPVLSTYYCKVYNGCGTITSLTITVTGNPLPTVTGTILPGILCSGNPVTISGTGAPLISITGGYTSGMGFVPTATGINRYTITGTDINGCSNNSLVNVTVNNLPTLSISGSNSICPGASAALTASGANSYNWSNGLTASGISVSPLANTLYSVTGTDLNGCSNTLLVNITVNNLPTLSISGSNAICPGTAAALTVSGANSYNWSNGFTTSGISVSPLINTLYSVVGTDLNGCQATARQVVSVTSIVNIPISGKTNVCKGDSTILLAVNVSSVIWSNNSITTSISLHPESNITVSLTGITLQGCIGQGFATVIVNNLPGLTISGKASICSGSTTILSVAGAETYSWSTNATTTSINVSPASTTVYTIIGTGTNRCEVSKEVSITVNSLPGVSLDLSGINNQCDTLSPIPLTGGSPTPGSYWYNNRSIINLNTSLAGEYLILYKYTDQNGCINTATGILTSIHCTVPGICERPNAPCYCTNTCPPRFKVYTGITPNNDGRNDTWLIDSLAPENTVAVLDKWGNEVYRKEHYNNDWDGKQDGKELSSGVYYYMVENDRKRFSGTVSIIR